MDTYSRGKGFRLGRIHVKLSVTENSIEQLNKSVSDMDLLIRLLTGSTSPREAELAVKLLLGKTVKERIRGEKVTKLPCGCRERDDPSQ